MSDLGWTYEQALGKAQARGYAEADPTLDVDGTDAAQKLAILAQIAFGAPDARAVCDPELAALIDSRGVRRNTFREYLQNLA